MVPVGDTILGGRVQFDHIAQQVPDIAAAVRWQCDLVAGTRVLYQDAAGAPQTGAGEDRAPGTVADRSTIISSQARY